MDGALLAIVFFVTLLLIGVAMAAMALGSRLTGRCLRGSCGGPAARGPDGKELEACANCPNREDRKERATAALVR